MRTASPRFRLLVTLGCLALSGGAGLYVLSQRGGGDRGTVDATLMDIRRQLPADQAFLEAPEGSTFRRPALSEEQVETLFPQVLHPAAMYHPRQYFGFAPNVKVRRRFGEHPDGGYLVTTNSLGLRRSTEVAVEPPDLRVLVVGDSHVDGVCNSEESFPFLLEQSLRARGRDAEVLNAARGGQSPVNYPGTIERYADLGPDEVIVMFTGANDFLELLGFGRLFQGYETDGYTMEALEAREEALELDMPVFMSGLHTGHALHVRQADLPLLEGLVVDAVRELALVARDAGASVTVVLLPPTALVEGLELRSTADAMLERLGVSREQVLAQLAPLAGLLEAACQEVGAGFVDLHPHMTPECFWEADLHLSLVGQGVVRDVLLDTLPYLRD